nr:fimbria/pilus periplasmic chaperone [Variovorax sp. S12S4]
MAHAFASASGLQVSPVTLTLQASQNAEGLWLSNTGDTVVHAQVRVYQWTQEDGAEKLTPSRELLVSPPMVQLDASARQLIRVIRTGVPAGPVEGSYRVIIDELPVEMKEKKGLQLVLRYSVPIFIAAAGARAVARTPAHMVASQGRRPGRARSRQQRRHACPAGRSGFCRYRRPPHSGACRTDGLCPARRAHALAAEDIHRNIRPRGRSGNEDQWQRDAGKHPAAPTRPLSACCHCCFFPVWRPWPLRPRTLQPCPARWWPRPRKKTSPEPAAATSTWN